MDTGFKNSSDNEMVCESWVLKRGLGFLAFPQIGRYLLFFSTHIILLWHGLLLLARQIVFAS